jgi:voltage-gated sodium channel
MNNFAIVMEAANTIFIAVYVVEMLLKVFAWRGSYFKNGWNVFDFLIVVISLVPTGGIFSGVRILRVLRVLRSLRLITGVKQLRKIVQAVISSLPGIGWTALLMVLLYYIYAIIGIHLYREQWGALFGGFPEAFITLFSLTTLEGWQDIVYPFTDANPASWLYFLSFMVIASFILLNLVVGIVIDNIDEMSRIDAAEEAKQHPKPELSQEIEKLREQLAHVEKLLDEQLVDGKLSDEQLLSERPTDKQGAYRQPETP